MASSNPTDAQRRRLTATTTLRPDRNRQLEILAVVAIYVFVVHYVLKFAAFLMPDDSPSREEMLGLRGATGVMGFSTFDGGGSGSSSLASRRRRGGGGGGFNVVSKKSHLNWIPSDDGDRKNVPLFHHSGVSSTRNNRFHSLSASLQAEDAIQITTTKDNSTNSETSQDEEVIQNANNTTTTTTTPATAARNFKRQRIPILSYKNTHCIVSKPTSMTMHHNSNTRWGRSKSPVLQTTIHKQLGRKPYLVHRLDHRTSGACVLGFDSKVAGELHGRLRGAGSKKLYVALVRGDLRDRFQLAADSESDSAVAAAAGVGGAENGVDMSVNGDGSVVGTAGKMPAVATPERFEGFYSPADQSDLNGSEYRGRITVDLPIKLADDIEKEAQTDFYFLSSIDLEEDDDDATATADDATTTAAATPKNNGPYTSKSLTLLLCHPKTGRTHQIRRHVRKAFNAPIIGDSEHGDSRVNRFWRTNVGLDRLALHCWYLELPRVSSESVALSSSSTDDDDDDDDDVSSTSESIQCMAPLTPDFADGLQHEMLRPLWEEATTVEPRLKMEPYDERGGTFGRHYRKRKEEGSGE